MRNARMRKCGMRECTNAECSNAQMRNVQMRNARMRKCVNTECVNAECGYSEILTRGHNRSVGAWKFSLTSVFCISAFPIKPEKMCERCAEESENFSKLSFACSVQISTIEPCNKQPTENLIRSNFYHRVLELFSSPRNPSDFRSLDERVPIERQFSTALFVLSLRKSSAFC
jgi:hypothetical protein